MISKIGLTPEAMMGMDYFEYLLDRLNTETSMKNKAIILFLSAFFALVGQSQTKVWNNIVTGYVNPPIGEVRKVAIYDDRTEVFFHMDFPKQAVGQEFPIATKPALHADGKQYAVKGATVISLAEPYKIPENGKVDFSLIFEPIPSSTFMMDVAEPKAWSFSNIRNADDLPTGIANTYWRNDATGDWIIGFAPKHVIYKNKVWDIVNQTEKKNAFTLTLDNDVIVKVGKMKKGLRTIVFGNEKPITCSPITGAVLPEYPTKDQRVGFVDNGYKLTDSVTVVGWLKDMPKEAWRNGKEFKIDYNNIFNDKEEGSYAKMDSIGRFSLKMPLLNTSQVFLDWRRTNKSTVLEPGKTYFFLYDFMTGQTLWMGDDVRVQNELLQHPHNWSDIRIEQSQRGKVTAMDFKAQTDSSRAANMANLKECFAHHPNLSQRYIDYVEGYYQTGQGESMMQARFAFPNHDLPKEYMDFVNSEFWRKAIKPYTLYRDFAPFLRDYIDHMVSMHGNTDIAVVFKQFEKKGKLVMTDEEKNSLEKYAEELKQVQTDINAAKTDEERQKIADAFNSSNLVADVTALYEKNKDLLSTYGFQQVLDLVDSLGCERSLRDIILANRLYNHIDNTRSPLEPTILNFAEREIQLPAALTIVKNLNERYIAIQNMDITKSDNLKSNDDVAGMSDGEKILRKIIEPYKGKIILLDVWGTWCGPCKEALSHSQEEYERLKDFDLVYLYLCNRSSDESWKNVIKEYDIVGDNVVHYNLPVDQQSAVENFLHVNAFPTYKLIDRNGNVLDVNADPRDLEGIARILEQMK